MSADAAVLEAPDAAAAIVVETPAVTPAVTPAAVQADGKYDYGDPDDDGPLTKEPEAKAKTPPPKREASPSVKAGKFEGEKKPVELGDPADTEFADDPDDAAAADAVATETDTFDAALLRQAEVHGYTQAEAEAFGEDSLRAMLTAADRRAVSELRKANPPATEPATNPAAAKAVPNTAAPVATPTADSNTFEKYKVELDPKEYDAGTIKFLTGLNDHYDAIARRQATTIAELKAAVDPLRQNLDTVTGRFAAEEHARFSASMDTFFNGLGDDFKDTFGKGQISDLAPSSKESKARVAVANEMEALRMADLQLGRQSSVVDLQQRALRLLHSDKLVTQARGKIVKQVADRREQSVARPSARQTTAKSPEEAASRFAKQFYRDHGGEGEDEAPGEI